MSFSTVVYTIYAIVKGTPIYVWFLFAYLVSRGIHAINMRPLSLKKMLIIPMVFTIWGLDTMFTKYTMPHIDFVIYLTMALVGTGAGFALYRKAREIIEKDGSYYQTGSYLPLSIMLINFTIKYMLGVSEAVQPGLFQSIGFCMICSLISGFFLGLFFGGWLQALVSYKRLVSGQVKIGNQA